MDLNFLEKTIEDVKIVIKPFSAKQLKLENAYSAFAGQSVLIRSGSIESPDKAHQFLKLIKEISKDRPLRVLSCQINNPENEWELIQSQNKRLASLNQSLGTQGMIAHLNLPIQPFLIDPKKIPSEFLEKTIKKLYRQLNMEGWMDYSRWLNEEMEKVLKTFKPEAADEYQLQARLEDFGIETHSLFLNDVEQELQNAILSMDRIELGENEKQEGSLFSLEKKAVALRERLKAALQIKYVLLNDIVTGISSIETAHPELFSLKCMAFLLAILLGQEIEAATTSMLTCEQQLLLVQILNQQLGVITAINCQSGLERTSIAFSLMLGMAEISQKFTTDELISMVLDWNKGNSPASGLLRRCVLANLEKFSVPITFKVSGQGLEKIPKGMQENLELLSYLPRGRSYLYLIKQLSE